MRWRPTRALVPNVGGKEIHTKELSGPPGAALANLGKREVCLTLIFSLGLEEVRARGVDSVRFFLFCQWEDGMQ